MPSTMLIVPVAASTGPNCASCGNGDVDEEADGAADCVAVAVAVVVGEGGPEREGEAGAGLHAVGSSLKEV